MKKIKLFTIVLLLVAFNFNTTAQNAGDNDPTFNSTDIGFGSGEGADNGILTTSTQPDGKIIIGGQFWAYNSTVSNRLARINSDGLLDNTFYVGTGANSTITTTAIQPDGKILVGGTFTSYNSTTRNYIARLNANGTIDGTFNGGPNNSITKIILQPDGKIIIGGSFTTYNGTTRNRIARLNVNGTLDTSFNPGTGANSDIKTIALQSNSQLIIGGSIFYLQWRYNKSYCSYQYGW